MGNIHQSIRMRGDWPIARDFAERVYLGVRILRKATLCTIGYTSKKASVAEGDDEVDVVRFACRGFENEPIQQPSDRGDLFLH